MADEQKRDRAAQVARSLGAFARATGRAGAALAGAAFEAELRDANREQARALATWAREEPRRATATALLTTLALVAFVAIAAAGRDDSVDATRPEIAGVIPVGGAKARAG